MILAIIFAQLWGVIQLLVLTSLSRTVRVRTVLAAMAVGFYAIGPITAFLQLSWIRVAAMLFGKSVVELTGVGSYTVDPFIEEAMKLLPLGMLMLIPAIRRQWSVTDCVLIAAATGSGFGLTEHLFRYANDPHAAQAVAGGWVVAIGSHEVLVPGILRSLTSWLPTGAFFSFDPIIINWHLAWSAIGGLGVGLIARRGGRNAIVAAAALFLFIGLNHASGNATDIQRTWLALFAAPLGFLTTCLGILTFATIVAAWWLDQPSQRAARALGPLLAAEESATSPVIGTFTVALTRLPWSIGWVYGFDRARRAYQAARVAAPDARDELREAMIAQRDSVDRRLKQSEVPPLLPPWMTVDALRSELRRALRRPPVIIWLVLSAPSVLYLIVGGWPQTAWLQSVLTGPVIWQLVLLITVFSLARITWGVIVGLRRLPATARLPIGDDAAMLGLQLACGVGAVSLGGFTLLRVLSGVSAGQTLLSHAHAADAANRVTPASGAAVAGSAGAAAPPPRSPDPEGSADAAAAGAAAGGSAANDGPAGDTAPGDGAHGDAADGPAPAPANDASHNEQAAEQAANEAAAARDAAAASDAAAAQAAAAQAEADGRTEDAVEASQGGALDTPPPSLDLPRTSADAAADAAAPASEGKAAGEYEGDRAAAAQQEGEDAARDAGEDSGDKAADDIASRKAPPPRQPTPQEQADQAADAASRADADAAAARQARQDAVRAADAADIKQATTDPGSDPDVNAARERVRAAEKAAEKADNDALDGDDPWDPSKPNKSAADASDREVKDAKEAQAEAERDYAARHAGDADPAKAAAKDAQDALDAANAKAAAAHADAANAAANAQNTAAKAASDAARAANPAQAASDDAQKALADAQAAENDAFFHRDAQGYRDARAALDAARQKADAAKAAADAARDGSSSSDHSRVKKP